MTSDSFMAAYKAGRRDFTGLKVTGGRFEICTDGAEITPIVLDGIDCANTTFKKIIFNSVKLSNSKLAGCVFEDVSFINCHLTSIDANVSSFGQIKIYNTSINGLDLRYSKINGIDMEFSNILPNGIIFGKNNLTTLRIFSESSQNIGIEYIKILDKVTLAESQFIELKKAGVDTQRAIVLDVEQLTTVRRINEESLYEVPSDI